FDDVDRATRQVDMAAPQREDLAAPESAETGEHDGSAEARGDGVGDRPYRLRTNDGPLRARLAAGAGELAGIAGDDLVARRGREDRAQEPVGLRARRCADLGALEVGPPRAHVRGRDRTELGLAERREDMVPPPAVVELSRPRAQRALAEPALRVVLKRDLAGLWIDEYPA